MFEKFNKNLRNGYPIEIEDIRGIYYVFDFENGFSAGVVRSDFSYGGREGLWEISVFKNNKLYYESDITHDVLGYLDETEVEAVLQLFAILKRDGHFPKNYKRKFAL